MFHARSQLHRSTIPVVNFVGFFPAEILSTSFTSAEMLQAAAAESLKAITPLWHDRQRPAAITVATAIITQTAESNLRASASILSAIAGQIAVLLQPMASVQAGGAAERTRRGATLNGQAAGEKLEAGCPPLYQLLAPLLAEVRWSSALSRIPSRVICGERVEAFRHSPLIKCSRFSGSLFQCASIQVLASSMKHERAGVRRLALQVVASEGFSAALPLSCACIAAGALAW